MKPQSRSEIRGEILIERVHSASQKKVHQKKLRSFVENQISRWLASQKDLRWGAPSRYRVLFLEGADDSTTTCQVEIVQTERVWKSSQTHRGIQQAFLECMRSLWTPELAMAVAGRPHRQRSAPGLRLGRLAGAPRRLGK